MKRWALRIGLMLLGVVLAGFVAAWLFLRASLPDLDGERHIAGLAAPVTIERDSLGVATVTAANRRDLVRATGYLHAQERFFQMDLLRRSATGDVAAVVGGMAINYDITRRRHGFRKVANAVFEQLPDDDRAMLEAYAEGVNDGMAALGARPFEYAVLRVEPDAWRPQDSLLVIYAMYFDLHDEDARRERFLAALHAQLPEALVEFLVPVATTWDAPIDASRVNLLSIPDPAVFDTRALPPAPAEKADGERLAPGSNNWAVDGAHSTSGVPIVANDMHLGLGVPNIWFRLRLVVEGADGFSISGVSLPGLPAIVAGSNGHVAWGFTNSYGDWIDLVELDTASCEDGYRTPEGCEAFHRINETFDVAHGDSVQRERLHTRWGPVIESPANGHTVHYALHWTAHFPEATNLELSRLDRAHNVSDALAIAQRSGIPPQNFIVVDSQGNIAWTIIGRIPRREGKDGRLPVASAKTGNVWQGWLEPTDYPVVFNPGHGRLWTANARVVGGEALATLGDGGYSLGARAGQIRDRLFEKERYDEHDMLQIQLDDEARFLSRWHTLLDELLDGEALQSKPARDEVKAVLGKWQPRASIESASYRFVDVFRTKVHALVFGGLTAGVKAEFPGFGFGAFSQSEEPLWQLVTHRPQHLLPPGHDSWRKLLLAVVDETQNELAASGPLQERTWGEFNRSSIRHPLGALPVIGGMLNAVPAPLPGDDHMPRVQGRGFGASERFAVSPGREEYGYMHMPGGQSGHPLSPFYLAGHEDWEEGNASPFLPGSTRYVFRLLPQEQ